MPLANSGREEKINQLRQKITRLQYRFKDMQTVLQRTRGRKKKYIACCFLHHMWTSVIFDGRMQKLKVEYYNLLSSYLNKKVS